MTSAIQLRDLVYDEGINPNYRDHLFMMTGESVFYIMQTALKVWGGNKYTDNEYLMATMNGLNNAGNLLGQNVTQAQIDEINETFEALLSNLNITKQQLNDFLLEQNNKTIETGKLSCAK